MALVSKTGCFFFGSGTNDNMFFSMAQVSNPGVLVSLAVGPESRCSGIGWFPAQGAQGLVGSMFQLVRDRVGSGVSWSKWAGPFWLGPLPYSSFSSLFFSSLLLPSFLFFLNLFETCFLCHSVD